jgi:signal transduction histidine kinase
LHVANGGQVIPPGDVDGLFEPFRRGGKLRTGTRGAGLGLSIVRLIVEAHHGRLQAAAPPFGGLAVRIELPRAADEPVAVGNPLAERVGQRGTGEVDLPGSRA